MTVSGAALVIVTSAVLLLGFGYSRDILSPSKLFVLVVALTFGEVVFVRQPVEVLLAVAVLLALGAFFVVWEGHVLAHASGAQSTRLVQRPHSVACVWAVSVVAAIAQLYMVVSLGGIEAYLLSVGARGAEWAGLGPVRSFVLLMPVANVVYGIVVWTGQKGSRGAATLFAAHSALTLVIAVLTGSRTTLVGWLLALLVVRHFAVKPLRLATAAASLAALICVVVVVGAFRGAYKPLAGRIAFAREAVYWQQGSVLNYGSEPLKTALEVDPPRLYYGATFATALSNVVPRALWPGKPPTGGVVYTREFLHDQWRGRSYASPGIFAELALNFGRNAIPFGVLVLGVVMHGGVRLWAKAHSEDRVVAAYWAGLYAMSLPLTLGLVFLEFTNAVVGTALKILPYVVMVHCCFRRDRV
jgi:hypothetical protein